MKRYLVLAVFFDSRSHQVITHSKKWTCGNNDFPEDNAEKIIESIADSGLGKDHLFEVFVFQSINSEMEPKQVAYWNLDDELFGGEEMDFEDEDEGYEFSDD